MSKLEAILSQEVEAEIRSLLEEAKARAEGLRKEAEAKAEALLQGRKRALEAQFQAALRRAESAGELLLATARTQAKGEVLQAVRAKAEEALLAFPGSPSGPGSCASWPRKPFPPFLSPRPWSPTRRTCPIWSPWLRSAA